MRLDPLSASEDQFEDLRYLVTEERKQVATQHKYREGQKYNGVVSHVDDSYCHSRKVNMQQHEQALLKEAAADSRAELEGFDRETKRLEKALIDVQKEKREGLVMSHKQQLDEFEGHWGSAGKFRMYNRSSNQVTVLRRQLALLLVQCRFRDAEEVRRLVDQATKAEEDGSHRLMQKDYDLAFTLLENKQRMEFATLEEGAAVELQKFHQDRAFTRRVYEIRARKIAARMEIAGDLDRLWNHEQTQRMLASTAQPGKPSLPSTKMTRKDIKEQDVAVLSLPPLSSRRKKAKPGRATAKG
jgi:hypothetical protein